MFLVEGARLHLRRRKEDLAGWRGGSRDRGHGTRLHMWTKKVTQREVIQVCFRAIENIDTPGVESSYREAAQHKPVNKGGITEDFKGA